MFSRSSRTKKKVVAKPAAVKVIKPEQEQSVLDLSKAKITIIWGLQNTMSKVPLYYGFSFN